MMENKEKKYPVSYFGGDIGAWLCVILAVVGIMYMLLIRGGGTKSMIVVLFCALVFGLVLAKDRKAYGDEMLKGLQESIICTICMAFFMAGLLSALLKTSGLIQALFDLYGIRYTGTGHASSALCMDKSITKEMFRCYHVPTPAGITVRSEEELILPEDFTYPCMVKTCCGGSSVGVYRVENEDELHVALKEAFTYEDHVIIEKCIIGREFSIAVVEGKALPVIEIAPLTGFYDYKNKYQAGSTIETCPADLPSEVAKRMQQHAEEACAAVSIQSYARVDFMLDTVTMEDYALEVNTLPGMTPTSLMPQEAQALGLSFDDLCEWILAVSLKKYK